MLEPDRVGQRGGKAEPCHGACPSLSSAVKPATKSPCHAPRALPFLHRQPGTSQLAMGTMPLWGLQCCVLIHDQFLAVSPDWSTEAGIGGGAHAHEPGFSANPVLTSHDLEPDWDTEMAWLSDGAFSDGLCCLIWPGYLS